MTEEITSNSPQVGELTEVQQTDDTNSKPPSRWDGVPETIVNSLCDPPVLPHEIEDLFFALFDSYRNHFFPENILEFDLVYTVTVCKWEVNRYRSMAIAATSNQRQAGLELLFARTHKAAHLEGAEQAVKIDAAKMAKACFADSDYCEDAYCNLESMGYFPNSAAFLLSLPTLKEIERLLASAEKRYAAAVKSLDRNKLIGKGNPTTPKKP